MNVSPRKVRLLQNINELPDNDISAVLQYFTISQLMQLRVVCRRWDAMVRLLCKKQTSIKLFSSAANYSLYCKDIENYNLQNEKEFRIHQVGPDVDNVLRVNTNATANRELWAFLGELLPNVNQLTFCIEQPEHLTTLLEEWEFHQLKSLVIFGPFPVQETGQRPFWSAINSLSTLTRLHLFDLFDSKLPTEMPVLRQLQHLTVVRYENKLTPHLQQLSGQCTSITLGSCLLTSTCLQMVAAQNADLANSLTNLRLSGIFVNLTYYVRFDNSAKVLETLCRNFTSITTLDLMYFRITIADCLAQISNLPSLTTLEANLDYPLLEREEEPNYALRLASLRTLILLDDREVIDPDGAKFYSMLPSVCPAVTRIEVCSTAPDRLEHVKRRIFPSIGYDFEKVKLRFRLLE